MFLPGVYRRMGTNHWEVGTCKRHTYSKESGYMINKTVMREHVSYPAPPEESDPELEVLVREIIGRVADDICRAPA